MTGLHMSERSRTMISRLFCRTACAVLLCLGLAGCSDSSDRSKPPGPYAADDLWLCKPGIAEDRCLQLDLTTTHIFEDNSQVVFQHEVALDPEYDCFYVYPTVDQRSDPGNMQDLVAGEELMLRPLYNQAARFTSLCKVFAPKYRQMTIGSYAVEDVRNSEFFATAFADVDEAFAQYLLENPRRNFVLLGHSQGSHMLLELLAQRFENNAQLRERLISALVIGPVGWLEVPPGEVAGGSFDNLPLCTHATDNACIVAYDTNAEGVARPEPDQALPCTDPTRLGGAPGILENMFYNDQEGIPFPPGVETGWIAWPAMHTANCDSDGYLSIDTVQQDREPTVTPQVVQLFLGGSLHQADYNYTLGDLLRLVSIQADSMP